MLKVSIIINNYNYGRFLGEAIDSALSQTYPRLEVIVVDDGSTDNSREVIASYGDRIISVFKPNGGQASAMNAGFAACTGDLVIFLDSDDMLLPAAVEAAAGEWREGLALLYFPLEVVDESGEPLGRLAGGEPMSDPALGSFSPGSPTSGNTFRRKLLEKAMPIPEGQWRICADSYLAGACGLLGAVKALPNPLGRYRVHGSNNFASKEPGLAETRRTIRSALVFHESMSRVAGGKILPLDQWLATNHGYWIARMRSLRGDRASHPWDDTLRDLIRRAARATWRNPSWNLRRRLAYTTLAILYGIAPKIVVDALKRAETRAATPAVRFFLGQKRQTRSKRHAE